jgi:4-nitrophenyl phosphatase
VAVFFHSLAGIKIHNYWRFSAMKQYKGYLIDLDGTMYRGEERIDAASRFVTKLAEQEIPHLFVTNNSSKTPEQVSDKLLSMDIPAKPEQVVTSSVAAARFIKKQYGETGVYMIGEKGLKTALEDEGHRLTEEAPEVVVMGIDHEISYEKLANAALAVRNGAAFISTNGDVAIPTERGLLPGNGALTSVVEVSTGQKPVFIGKPESVIVELALEMLGTSLQDTVMVGDNYQTDILAGINAGMDTIIVHTGVTAKDQLGGFKIQPSWSIDSLDDWKF